MRDPPHLEQLISASRDRVGKRPGVFLPYDYEYAVLIQPYLPPLSFTLGGLPYHPPSVPFVRLPSAASAAFATLGLASCAINVPYLALRLTFLSASSPPYFLPRPLQFPPDLSVPIQRCRICHDYAYVYSDLVLYLCQPQSAPGLLPSTDRVASRPTFLFPFVFPLRVAGSILRSDPLLASMPLRAFRIKTNRMISQNMFARDLLKHR